MLNPISRKLLLGQSIEAFIPQFVQKALKGQISFQEASAILTTLAFRGEQGAEIAGAVREIRSLSKTYQLKLPFLVDTCGTGGDGLRSINISSLAAIVAAGAGANVAKHGNKAISSRSGSSDFFSAAGVRVDLPTKEMMNCLKICGLGYFHAPLYYPLLKAIAPIRISLKHRSLFNLLGPLLNPMGVKRQVIGLASMNLLDSMADAVTILGCERVFLIHSSEGFDEIVPKGRTLVREIVKKRIKSFVLTAKDFGYKNQNLDKLAGGSAKTNLTLGLNLLNGNDRSCRFYTVAMNAALVLLASGRADSLKEGVEMAELSIESGAALRVLSYLVENTNDLQ